jgi:hypothetical protein
MDGGAKNDISDFEDVSGMTGNERNEKLFLDHFLKLRFNIKPELYKELIKCIHLYTIVIIRKLTEK